MPVQMAPLGPMDRLELEISATLQLRGMRLANARANPPRSGYTFRHVRGGIEVYYVDAERRPDVQTDFVRVAGIALTDKFGAQRVSRTDRGRFQGFKISLT